MFLLKNFKKNSIKIKFYKVRYRILNKNFKIQQFNYRTNKKLKKTKKI